MHDVFVADLYLVVGNDVNVQIEYAIVKVVQVDSKEQSVVNVECILEVLYTLVFNDD